MSVCASVFGCMSGNNLIFNSAETEAVDVVAASAAAFVVLVIIIVVAVTIACSQRL